MHFRVLRSLLILPLLSLLTGCEAIVLKPFGDIAIQQGRLVVVSTILMLLIVVPVMLLTVFFAWRYRASNTAADYDPEWHHSTLLELVIWSAPLLIIIALGAITWIGTHTLDPYRPLDRIGAGRAVPAQTEPLRVQVVALDWKWLFIYPDLGIATVNEMAAPVDRPIRFDITASTVMNSFYVPALAGQIYAMPGMQTQLHAVINHAGDYDGFSANYSGAGFSHMRFRFLGRDTAGFDAWVAKVRAAGGALQGPDYLQLERPSEREPVRYFARVAEGLFDRVVNLCVDPAKMCMHEMMAIDARGGLGKAGLYNLTRLDYDRQRARTPDALAARTEYVSALCANDPQPDAATVGSPTLVPSLGRPASTLR